MTALTRCSDLSAADWLVGSVTDAARLITFGPDGFAAYARLRYVPDPAVPGQRENDVEVGEDHPHDLHYARRALQVLAGYTATPGDCWFGVWDGYGDIVLPGGPLLTGLRYRDFALLRGPLDAIDTWECDFGDGELIAPPALVWPADRAWFFASDVEPHWAGIGAARAAVDALTADCGVDAVCADPSSPQPYYY